MCFLIFFLTKILSLIITTQENGSIVEIDTRLIDIGMLLGKQGILP